MRRKEDEFKKPVVRELQNRVNGRCSRCGAATRGPHSDGERSITVGEAAHITAAAEGGPRYDASLTPEQRSSIDNGIWLCKTCARMVDVDDPRFTVELLRNLKAQAEASAQRGLGKRIPDESDIGEAVHQIVTGYGTRMQDGLMTMAATSTVRQMQQLDPRWRIKPSFRDGREQYFLTPLENITLHVGMPDAERVAANESLRRLRAHGIPAELDISKWMITGSPLIERLLSQSGSGKATLQLESPHRFPSELFITADPSSAFAQSFGTVSVRGETSIGTESVTFRGTGFDGVLIVTLQIPTQLTRGANAQFSFDCDYEVWTGKPVARLPHLSKALALAEALASPEALTFDFEIDGYRVLREQCVGPRRSDFDEMVYLFRFLDYLAEVCRFIKSPVVFATDLAFTQQDYDRVEATATAIRSGGTYTKVLSEGSLDAPMLVTKRVLEMFDHLRRASAIRFVPQEEAISIGGNAIPLPAISYVFTNTKLVEPSSLESLRRGRSARFVWKLEDTERHISLISEEAAEALAD